MNIKKSLARIFIITIVCASFVSGVSQAKADDDVSLSQLVELFISLGFIPAEKAAQARAAVTSASASDSCATVSLSRDLAFGSKNADVAKLQTYLAKDTSLYPEGLITGYFGASTKQAVQRFQKKYKIVSSGTGYGVVGPMTRAEMAKCHTVTASGTSSSSAAKSTKPTISFLYPVARAVYPVGERLVVVTQVSGISAANARVRYYISGGVYKSTWQELDQTYTQGGFATLTIPQSVVSVWGVGTPFKLKAELEQWEVGAFVKKAEATMSNTFTLSSVVTHAAYYSTGSDAAAYGVYTKLRSQAGEFGSTFPYVGVDSVDINGDGANDVIGFINSIQGPLCGSKGCRLSLWVSGSSAKSTDRTPVYFDGQQYRNAHGSVMVLTSKSYGYNDLAFLSTSGKFDLWRWDGDSYAFSRTVSVLPGVENEDTNANNSNTNTDDTSDNDDNDNSSIAPPPPPPPAL